MPVSGQGPYARPRSVRWHPAATGLLCDWYTVAKKTLGGPLIPAAGLRSPELIGTLQETAQAIEAQRHYDVPITIFGIDLNDGGIGPLSWIPNPLGRRNPQCHEPVLHTGLNFATRWWNWFARGDLFENSPVTSNSLSRPFATGSARPISERVPETTG